MEELDKLVKLEELLSNIERLEKVTQQDDFWQNQKNVQKVMNELNSYKDTYNSYKNIKSSFEDLNSLLEIIDESNSQEMNDLEELFNVFINDLEQFKTSLLLDGPHDKLDAIVEFHPGAGGTESQDWALMLYRMYKRFAEKHNFAIEILDWQDGEEAGIKSVTCLMKGHNAYGLLRGEKGVHRLVRISPFDSNARRHTSFASVEVIPNIDDNIEVEIKDDDLKIDTFRSGGAGGQSVNTTDSAVRITHKPSGIVVSCQNERSQIQNREQAFKLLRAKLYQVKLEEQQQMLAKLHGERMDNSWGSQIRSYVLHPYALVKDHRTNFESSNPTKVFDGDLDGFIDAYLKMR